MFRNTVFLCVIVAFSLINMKVSAQNGSNEKPEALTRLMQFEGYWEGPFTLTLDGKSFSMIYYTDFRTTAGGSGMTMDEWFTSPDLGSMKGSNLIGYNANDQKIHWFSVDNFGTAHEHIGTWLSPNHFSMQANEMQNGKRYVENIDCTFTAKDKITFKLVATLDGSVFEEIAGTFTRKPRPAKASSKLTMDSRKR